MHQHELQEQKMTNNFKAKGKSMIQIVLKQNKDKNKKGAEGEYIFAKSSITHHDFQEETG